MSDSASQWLEPDELVDLTERVRPSAQREWLDRYGIPYFQSASGRPQVERAAIDPLYAPQLAPEIVDGVPITQYVRERLPDLISLSREDVRAARVVYNLGDGPPESGIYFLFLRWALVYVGQSTNIARRLRAHFEEGRPFTGFHWISVPERMLDNVESSYIGRLRPPLNVRGKSCR